MGMGSYSAFSYRGEGDPRVSLMKKKYTRALSALLIASVVGSCIGCGTGKTEQDTSTAQDNNVIASINNQDITEGDIEEMLHFMSAVYSVTEESEDWEALKYSTIQAYLNDKVCTLKAEEMGIEVTDEEVQSEMDYMIAQYGQKEAYEEYISSMNITNEFIENQMRSQLIYSKLFDAATSDVSVADEEVAAYYNDHPEEFITDETRDIYGIAFAAKEEADAALADLKAGNADFAAMANEKSLDNPNGDGFLGTVAQGDMMDAFDTAIFSMPEEGYYDEVLALDVEQEEGGVSKFYYVIKAENFIPSKSLSFDEMKDDIMTTLTNEQKTKKYDELFNTWKNDFSYVIYE